MFTFSGIYRERSRPQGPCLGNKPLVVTYNIQLHKTETPQKT